MTDQQLQRVKDFYVAFSRRQAGVVHALPRGGGVAVRHDTFWASHEHNQLLIDGAPPPPAADELPGLADTALADLPYRRITVVDDAAGEACAPVLTAAGYRHEPEMIMIYQGDSAARRSATPAASRAEQPPGVAPVGLDELRTAAMAQLRRWMPEADDLVVRHLTDRRAARALGAERVEFLAARDPDGVIGSWADLYVDPPNGEHGGIAQIEDVVTADSHLRRGYADAVLHTALRTTADCDLLFLLAEPDDWPRHWYARRGFVPAGYVHVFTAVAPTHTS